MDLFSKTFKFQLFDLLKLVLFLVSTGAVLCIYYRDIAWILVLASFFLIFYEISKGYQEYKKSREKKQ